MIKTDSHIHSEYSHDSVCKITDSARSAKEKGFDTIVITDHCDIGYADIVNLTELFTNAVNAVRDNDYPITVLAGVEIGETVWDKAETEKILNGISFDQIIGSVHAVRFAGYTMPYSQIDFSKFSREDLNKYLSIYFDELLETAEYLDMDILAHITCPLRYINGKYDRNIDCRMYKEEIEKILETIIKRGIVLEINTSNCGSNYDELMPEEWIIEMYKNMGGKYISCGSDSHVAKNIGHSFDRLYETLKKYGFEYTCYFKNREMVKCPIGEAKI